DLVQKRFRRLGDRLLGIVELAEEQKHSPNFSPSLYRAAIQQVAGEAMAFNFREAVDPRPARRRAGMVLGLAGLIAVLFAIAPKAGWNALVRLAFPARSIERFTLVRLEEVPPEKVVAHGEPFELTARVQYESFWKPRRAFAQFQRQPKIAATVQRDYVSLRVPGQVQPGPLRLKMGDAERTIQIVPAPRPSLKELSARVELPEYLEYPQQTIAIPGGSLTVLQGSRVTFRGRASRPLAAAILEIPGVNTHALNIEADNFSSPSLSLDQVLQCVFTWEDNLGLASAAPWRLAVQQQKDLPPTPEFVGLNRESVLLESEILELKAAAEDDFGVRELGVYWELVTDWASTNAIRRKQDIKVLAPGPKEKQLSDTFYFSPSLLQLPADSTVELRAYAVDAFPGRDRSESPPYRVYILGREQHAEMVRRELESMLAQLEEVTRLEEKIAAATKELQITPESTDQAATDQLNQLVEDQHQNAELLERLAREGMKALREALRNPAFPEEALSQWTQNLHAMQQLSREQMKAAAAALQSAQQNQSSRAKDLAEAREQEQSILDQLEQLQKQVNRGLDDLQAMTLAQRLRKLGTEENEIETALEKLVPETIGLLPEDLPAPFKRANASLAGKQDATLKEAQVLLGEISRFFERTQKQNYGEVSKEMSQARTDEELLRVRELIQSNIAMEASQHLTNWAHRFNDWADRLEPKQQESASGSGSGSGSGEGENMMEQLLALLRIRQGELTLREQTRLLDRDAEAENYPDRSRLLAEKQAGLRTEFQRNRIQLPMEAIQHLSAQTYVTMEEAEALLAKPQTDTATQGSQTKVVEHLSDLINLINEQAQRGGQSNQPQEASMAEEMAFLMEMMAQAAGMNMTPTPSPTGGGNMAGGGTDRTGSGLPGEASGPSGPTRTTRKAAGTTQNLPTEFREALQNYFNALEQNMPAQ
ncbi:MAG: hypothetical protein AB1813_11290, partial [Verrucomicrobiota bacterium]